MTTDSLSKIIQSRIDQWREERQLHTEDPVGYSIITHRMQELLVIQQSLNEVIKEIEDLPKLNIAGVDYNFVVYSKVMKLLKNE